MRLLRIAIITISVVLIAYQLRQRLDSAPTPDQTMFATAQLRIGQQTVTVRVPTTTAASEQGLSGVSSLSDTEGMYWEFSEPSRPTFWMKGMLIPLDFIWVRDGRVTEITPDVPAPVNGNLPLYQPKDPVTNVLEVSAGFAKRHSIQVGTLVENQEN
jgi:uncharacterized membrane protein (UPF0127 family)